VSTIVGRETELELVDRFLTAMAVSAHALHLRGEAGIGKSTIWQRAMTDASQRGHLVLNTRPTEVEARLPFAGLNDLFGALFDELQSSLPDPQRRALAGALLRSRADDASADPLAVSLGVLGLLRAAADRGPVLMAIDDVPWLDDSSASTLEFVVRRLDAEPIGFLTAERTSGDRDEPREARLVSAMSAERVTEIRVAPLSMADTDRLLAVVLGLALAPSSLKRLHGTSGGNPFYAVEIGRALQRRGGLGVGGDVPVPDTLSGLLRDRLDALSAAASDVVEHASALSQPTMALLTALLGSTTVVKGVAEAGEANVIALDGDVIRFTHPLLAAELYRGLGDLPRRTLHKRLAEVVSEPEEHAWHVALAAVGPDEAVAAGLERAAERAHARGAPDAAADLVEHALRLTPGQPEQLRRLQVAARYHLRAGDIARSRACLEQALERAPSGEVRAGILLQLGEVRVLMDDWIAGEQLFTDALTQVIGDVRLEIEIRLQLGGVSHITGRNWDAGAGHVMEAMRLAESLGDGAVLARTIGPYVTWTHLTMPDVPAHLESRAAELEPWTGQLRTMEHPDFDFANIQWADGDVDGALRIYLGLLDRAERAGDYSSIPFLLGNVSGMDFSDGRADVAFDRLDRAERLARATGQRTSLGAVLTSRTSLLARLGRADEAWKVGRDALDLVAEIGWIHGEPQVRKELALLELSRRAPEAALEVLRPFGVPPGADDSSWVLWQSWNHAEVLIALGRLSDARAILDGWERHAPMRNSAPRMRRHIRTRALLEAAAGNLDQASQLISLAETAGAPSGSRWWIARVALVAAEIHRRARRRAKARDALIIAAEAFDFLGARLWAGLAREQLNRVVGTREDEHGLTPTQLQVAELVKQGLTNREVGERLFMSPHTVEAHLSATYRALDIHSRVELPDALRSRLPPRDSAVDLRDSSANPDVER